MSCTTSLVSHLGSCGPHLSNIHIQMLLLTYVRFYLLASIEIRFISHDCWPYHFHLWSCISSMMNYIMYRTASPLSCSGPHLPNRQFVFLFKPICYYALYHSLDCVFSFMLWATHSETYIFRPPRIVGGQFDSKKK